MFPFTKVLSPNVSENCGSISNTVGKLLPIIGQVYQWGRDHFRVLFEYVGYSSNVSLIRGFLNPRSCIVKPKRVLCILFLIEKINALPNPDKIKKSYHPILQS